MSFMNLFILSYFGMMVNKETIGVCVFLIYLCTIYQLSVVLYFT